MVTTGAIIHGKCFNQLNFNNEIEHPVAIQLGGSDPNDLSECAKICEELGYDEINLNVGCPSERVQKGSFGACLMEDPQLVDDCIQAMQQVVSIPITVKCRIGINERDDIDFLNHFVSKIYNPNLKKNADTKVFSTCLIRIYFRDYYLSIYFYCSVNKQIIK